MINQATNRDDVERTILIVDDNPTNIGVVAQALEHYGYRILVAQDGEEGIERAGIATPDLILLDVMLPGIDGMEVCRRLKAAPDTCRIPVIIMTALTAMEDKLHAFKSGAVDYITKPLQLEEVVARVATQMKLAEMRHCLQLQNEELMVHRNHLEQLVSERTEELALANDALRLRSYALDHVKEAAYLVDVAGRIHYVNREACRRLGYSEDELLALTLGDVDPDWPLQQRQSDWSSHMKTIRERGGITFETRHKTRAGEVFPVEVSVNFLEFGDCEYLLGLARDITERKNTEKRLADYNKQLRDMARYRELSREEERKHIARELHDELGQYLTALGLHASVLCVEFGDHSPRLAGKLDEMLALVDVTKKVTRRLSQRLRPAVLDMGLDSALESLADEFALRYGIRCLLCVDAEADALPEPYTTAVFRIVQESLTNIARHAGAGMASIALHCNDNVCMLEICDDGVGFDIAGVKPSAFGLIGMRERLDAIGGVLDVVSEASFGTLITACFPLDGVED